MSVLWNVSASEYHADRSAVSCSMLKHLDEYGPEGFFRAYVSGEWDRVPTESMEFGTLIHRVLCDGEDIRDIATSPPAYLCSSDGGWRSGECRRWIDERKAAGLVVLKPEKIAEANAVVEAVRRSAIGPHLATATHQEQSFRWFDELTGVNLRCRIDVITPAYTVDFKSTRTDVSLRGVTATAASERYAWQNAIYDEALAAAGMEPRPFVFVIVEAKEPYRVRIIRVGPRSLAAARHAIFGEDGVIARLRRHQIEMDWSDPAWNGIVEVELPDYGTLPKSEPAWEETT